MPGEIGEGGGVGDVGKEGESEIWVVEEGLVLSEVEGILSSGVCLESKASQDMLHDSRSGPEHHMSSLKVLTQGSVAVVVGSDGSGATWLGEVHVCGTRTVLWFVFGGGLRRFVIMVVEWSRAVVCGYVRGKQPVECFIYYVVRL